uniref:EamA domain-containing protein n=1 Tax=Haptolina ericina TaxID=156174 RepID=A0A7S3EXH5_9EUKA
MTPSCSMVLLPTLAVAFVDVQPRLHAIQPPRAVRMFFVEEERQLAIWERDAAPAQVESQLQRQLEELKAPNLPPRSAEETAADADLLPWRLAMLGITASWGANFAVIKLALDTLGDTSSIADASSLFTAARFGISALLLCPFIMGASSRAVVNAGLGVGGLCTAGYACQVVSLSMGTQAGTSAFICSLQAVVVALLVARSTGCVAGRTWAAIGLSVAGVACLELPSVLSGGSGLCLGDLLAFGQPLGFGASYVVLQRAAADATEEDSLPLAALQCAAIGFCGLAAATLSAGQPPWDLDWSLLLPRPDAVNALKAWAVPGAVLYTGVISSALTIWLQAIVFSKLPAVDASLLISTEPLWAAAVAVVLLGDQLGSANYLGGALIISALLVNQGVVGKFGEEQG